MSLIISSEDIGNYEHLPNHDSIIHRVQIRIKQAQDFDLPKILPQKLIDDIVTNINSSSEEWVNLINKVRPVMVYFAFARFIEWHDFNTESFGFAKVNTNYSQKLQQGEKDQAARNARSLANGYALSLIHI